MEKITNLNGFCALLRVIDNAVFLETVTNELADNFLFYDFLSTPGTGPHTLLRGNHAEFSNLQLENFAERDRMRLFAMIGVRYETTPDQLRYILVEVRKLLYAHERVTADPARIRFVGFGAYSLDLEIFAYVDTSDWGEFLGIREDIYLRIMDIIESSGSGFAFPSQTLYLGRDDAPPAQRAEEVSQEVHRWRERNEVFLPNFPPERIAAIENTIVYPAEGSPDRRAGS